MFFRLFPSVMIDRKRLCLSGGSSVRNLRAAGPLFYSRIVRLFSSSRSGEFVRFSDFCRVAGKGTVRLAGAPMRREPHAPPRPGVFRPRRPKPSPEKNGALGFVRSAFLPRSSSVKISRCEG